MPRGRKTAARGDFRAHPRRPRGTYRWARAFVTGRMVPMATSADSLVAGLIRRLSPDERPKDDSDQELLRRFLDGHDEAAFEAVLRRHGPMVLSVCRSVLDNTADADDAFQATFFV